MPANFPSSIQSANHTSSQNTLQLPVINSSLHPNGVWTRKAYTKKLASKAKKTLDNLNLDQKIGNDDLLS